MTEKSQAATQRDNISDHDIYAVHVLNVEMYRLTYCLEVQ